MVSHGKWIIAITVVSAAATAALSRSQAASPRGDEALAMKGADRGGLLAATDGRNPTRRLVDLHGRTR